MTIKKTSQEKYTSTIKFDNNFQKIIQFYLFECPVEGASHRGEVFKKIGWIGSARFQMLERLLKAAAGMDNTQWFIVDSPSEVRAKSMDVTLEKQFLYSDKSQGRVNTFIYSIRCAFAHGSFDILEIGSKRHYLIENEYHGSFRTKMLVSEESLLEWIKIIKTKPEYLTKKALKTRTNLNKKNNLN